MREIAGPPPPGDNHAAVFVIALEATGGPGHREWSEPGRSSAIVVQPDPVSNAHHFLTHHCLRGPLNWYFFSATERDEGPRTKTHGLLAMDFVAWIPRAEVQRLGEMVSRMPFPWDGATEWNSRIWVQKALLALVQEGLLTGEQRGRTLRKLQFALDGLPFRGFTPNAPRR